MATPEGQPARPLETELKLAKSIVTWKLDTTFSVRVEMTWKQFVRKE